MNLKQRFNKFIKENKGKYSKSSIKRVRKFIDYETKNLSNRKPWRFLKQVDDFIIYFKIHPVWHGKSTETIQRNEVNSGGQSFYRAFLGFIYKKYNNSKQKRREIVQRIFEPKYKDWSNFTRIDDWVQEYKKHPEWHGKSTEDITHDKNGQAFYDSLIRFARNKANGNEQERKAIIRKIFEPKHKDWSSFITVDSFIKEYNRHPTWWGKSTGEIRKDKDGQIFYGALKIFARQKAKGNIKKHREIVQRIFEPKYKDWSNFTRIDDWVQEYKKHPEWHGKNTSEIQVKEIKSGGRIFYAAFRKFASRKSRGNECKRKAIMREIFPEKKAPFRYQIKDNIIYFDSPQERIIGLLLNKYGLIKDFIEGENLHVITSKRRHSIDFLIDDVFIEYHPLSPSDKKQKFTLQKTGKRKKENIKFSKFKEYGFYHIWEIEQLYDVLQDKKIKSLMNKRYKNLTKGQFEKHISEAYKKAIEYDTKEKNTQSK